MATNSSNALQHWKCENVRFVPIKETGALEPALLFAQLIDLGSGIHELENMRQEEPLRDSVLPEDEHTLKVEFLELLGQMERANEPCLIWLDRTRQPRVEWLDDRPTQTVQQAFWESHWIQRHLSAGKSPDLITAIAYLMNNRESKTTTTTGSLANTAAASAIQHTKAAPSASTDTAKVTSNENAPEQTAAAAKNDAMDMTSDLGPAAGESAATRAAMEESNKEPAPKESADESEMTVERNNSNQESHTASDEKKFVSPDQGEPVTTKTVPMEEELRRKPANIRDMQVAEPIESKTSKQANAVVTKNDTLISTNVNAMQVEAVTDNVAGSQLTASSDHGETLVDATQQATPTKKSKGTSVPRVSISPNTRPRRPTRGQSVNVPVIEDNSEEQFVFVTDKEATKILRKANFTIAKSVFVLPDKSASFSSLQELRTDLRRNGIEDCPLWTDDDRLTLQRWIRWSTLRSQDYSKTGVPDDAEVPPVNFRRLMTLGNFQYDGSKVLYMYPDVDPKTATAFTPGAFTSEGALVLSLAAHGLPDELYHNSSLMSADLLSLEKYVDEAAYVRHKRKLFERTASQSSETINDSPQDACGDKISEVETHAAAKSTSPPKKRQASPSKPNRATPSKRHKAVQEEASTPTTAVSHVTTEVSIDALPWPPSVPPVQEIVADNDYDRLSQAASALKRDGTEPVFSEDSKLGKNLKRIQDFVHATIRSTGRHGGTLEDGTASACKALYVCGVPGTGKTMGISWICKHVIQLQTEGKIGVEYDDDDENLTWRFCCINATRTPSVEEFRAQVAFVLGCNGADKIDQKLKKAGLVLVVDEIDGMLKSAEWRRLLTNLSACANDSERRLTLIGISNSLMDESYAHIQKLGQFREPMTFGAYSEDDLIHILRHRLGTNLMVPKGMEFIARKSVGDGGDARKTLDMARTVVESCLAKADSDNLTKGPLVQMKHVALLNRTQNSALADRIVGLPQVCKLCLFALSTMGKMQVTETTIMNLNRFVSACMDDDEWLTLEDFCNVLETLRDSGLLRMEKSSLMGMSPQETKNVGVRLGYQLEDVQMALDRVCKGKIYEKLAEYVESHRQNL